MNKADFIGELFESEIYGVARYNNHSREYSEILNNILEIRKELNTLLRGNEKELFTKYLDLQEQYVTENEFEGFAQGFRLGARCMLDILAPSLSENNA